MNKQIIRELFSGRLAPWEHKCDPGSERGKQESLVASRSTAFRAMLTPDQQPAFDDYVSEHYILAHLAEEDGFVEGFCLAIKLFMAALDLNDMNGDTVE